MRRCLTQHGKDVWEALAAEVESVQPRARWRQHRTIKKDLNVSKSDFLYVAYNAGRLWDPQRAVDSCPDILLRREILVSELQSGGNLRLSYLPSRKSTTSASCSSQLWVKARQASTCCECEHTGEKLGSHHDRVLRRLNGLHPHSHRERLALGAWA